MEKSNRKEEMKGIRKRGTRRKTGKYKKRRNT